MEAFNRVMKKLTKLEKRRADPSDHFINIVEAVRGENMTDEAWTNFYIYITSQNKDDWEYVSRDKVVTLGDLDPEYLREVEKTLEYPPEQSVKVVKNGIDIHIDVNYNPIKDKESNAEPMVSPR